MSFVVALLPAIAKSKSTASTTVTTPGRSGSVTALAKRGSYYLFHFARKKDQPGSNIGFFEPATPSKPLPVPPFTDSTFKAPLIPEFVLGERIFRVDMIDTWNMKVYPLGYTDGPIQKFLLDMAPAVMRFARVDAVESGKPRGSVQDLFEAFEAKLR